MRRVLATVAAMMLLATTACSGDDGSDQDDQTEPTEPTAHIITLDDLNPDPSLTLDVPSDLALPDGVGRESVELLTAQIEQFLSKSIDVDAVLDMPDEDVAGWTLTSTNTATRDQILETILPDVQPGPVGYVFADRFAADEKPTDSRILRAQWATDADDNGLLFVSGTVWTGYQFDTGVVLIRHNLELSAYPEDLPYEDDWRYGWNLSYGFHGAEPCRVYVDGVYAAGDQSGIEAGLDELREFLTAAGEQPQGFSEDGEETRDPATERENCLADGYEPATDRDAA